MCIDSAGFSSATLSNVENVFDFTFSEHFLSTQDRKAGAHSHGNSLLSPTLLVQGVCGYSCIHPASTTSWTVWNQEGWEPMSLGLAPGMERFHLVSLVQPIGCGHWNAELGSSPSGEECHI